MIQRCAAVYKDFKRNRSVDIKNLYVLGLIDHYLTINLCLLSYTMAIIDVYLCIVCNLTA